MPSGAAGATDQWDCLSRRRRRAKRSTDTSQRTPHASDATSCIALAAWPHHVRSRTARSRPYFISLCEPVAHWAQEVDAKAKPATKHARTAASSSAGRPMAPTRAANELLKTEACIQELMNTVKRLRADDGLDWVGRAPCRGCQLWLREAGGAR